MAARVCWNCEQAAHQTAISEPFYSRRRDDFFMAFQCDECGAASLAYGSGYSANNRKSEMIQATNLRWLPERYAGRVYDDVPEHIAAAASEAHTCFSAQAYRGAIILARAVVEATAKEKGATGRTLADRIDELHEAGHVRELVRETAHEIRYMGNDMAHGDFVEAVTAADAEDVLAFMAEVLDEVYQAPARLNARRSERIARKAQANATG